MSDNGFDPFGFREMNKRTDKMGDEFKRMAADLPYKNVKVGDRCIVATGFIGHGHLWVRKECVVIEMADTSVKVRRIDSFYSCGYWEEWIHAALITDVLEPIETEEK